MFSEISPKFIREIMPKIAATALINKMCIRDRRTLAAHQVAGLFGCGTGAGCLGHLFKHSLGNSLSLIHILSARAVRSVLTISMVWASLDRISL